MLQYLRIANLALLEEVSLEFNPGFTAVTGETGAGKSVLLGALRLLSGGRAEKSIIRQGSDTCEVEGGLFFGDPEPIDALLAEWGLPPCEDGTLLLKRAISRERMAKVFVNGSLTTVANLQRLGEEWIDFHGPEDPQRLFHAAFQLELLDLFARTGSELQAYRKVFHQWTEVRERREALAAGGRLSEEEILFFRNQIAKIDQCEISEESIAELESGFNRINRAQDLLECARKLSEGLAGDEGVVSQLTNLRRSAAELVDIDPALQTYLDRLGSLGVEAEDLGRDLEGLASEGEFSPEEAERVNTRMALWLELQRKMGGTVESVLAKREELARRIEEQGDIEGTLARLDREADILEKELRGLAADLRTKREKGAAKLSRQAVKEISGLGFQKADFSVRVVAEEKLTSSGGSQCAFFFSPNAGQTAQPLRKIASSGEIARVLLALKTVLAQVDRTPVLVFDEVDANVGGEIGRAVGEKMAELARKHQVFCVTHLPQVASLGDNHLVVEKIQGKNRTAVSIESLDGDRSGRLGELARMLGDRKAKSALAHAEELLK